MKEFASQTMKSIGKTISPTLSRRHALGLIGATALFTPHIARAASDARRIRLFHARTGERFEGTYFAAGAYQPEPMAELDHVLRDYNVDESIMMDVRLYDLFASLTEALDVSEAIRVTSGYRTIETNEKLRQRTRFAARNSLHIQGMAADFTIAGVSGRQLERAARSLRMGGVGAYSGASFIHVDVGAVRFWKR